jgi:hypothetical protein
VWESTVPKKSTARDPQSESLDDVLSFLCGEKQEKSASRPGWDCCRSRRRLQQGYYYTALLTGARGQGGDIGRVVCCGVWVLAVRTAPTHIHAWSDITLPCLCAPCALSPCLSSHSLSLFHSCFSPSIHSSTPLLSFPSSFSPSFDCPIMSNHDLNQQFGKPSIEYTVSLSLVLSCSSALHPQPKPLYPLRNEHFCHQTPRYYHLTTNHQPPPQ